MGRLIPAAAVLLVVQIGLVVAMNMNESGYTPYSPTELIAPIDADEIDALSITARDEGDIHLHRIDGKWFIVGEEGLTVPAANDQVETFLGKITSFKRGLAVATSEEAAERFEVQRDSPAYLLQLKSGGEVRSTLYFGTSPGFRQIHVRSEGSSDIVTVGLGGHELSPAVEQWIDKGLVKFETENLQTLVIDDLSLARRDDGWHVESLGDGGDVSVEGEKLERLVELVGDLSIHGFLAKKVREEGTGEDAITMETAMEDGSTLEWSIIKHGEHNHALDRSDLEYSLLISSWQLDDINKIIGEIQPVGTADEADGEAPHSVEARKGTDQVTD